MKNTSLSEYILTGSKFSDDLKFITQKVLNNKRIDTDEALLLYEQGEIGFLGMLANHVRENKNENKTYFNRNFHIEPTNVCVFSCNFCSYSRSYKHREEGWELSLDGMLEIVKKYDGQPVTEVHIV